MSGYKHTTEKELDDILSSALDEFDEDEIVEETSSKSKMSSAAAAAAKVAKDAEVKALEERGGELGENLSSLLEQMNDPAFADTLEETLTKLSAEGGDIEAAMNPFSTGRTGENGDHTKVLDADIAKTLQGLAEAAGDMEGMDPTSAEAMGEEVMKKMMEDFEKMGEKQDFNGVIDGMMKQLLSKDVMFTPMTMICEKYPEWLADNEERLSVEDYDRYGKQYQYFQQILAVYETEPDNFPRLTELFQDMQETGQPPSEIVKELAPGLEFGDDGMPLMAGMGPGVQGMMPGVMPAGMAGMEGMPENCTIM